MASWFRSKPSSGSSDASLEKQASDLLGGASDALRGLVVDTGASKAAAELVHPYVGRRHTLVPDVLAEHVDDEHHVDRASLSSEDAAVFENAPEEDLRASEVKAEHADGTVWHVQIVRDDHVDPKHCDADGNLKPRRPVPQIRATDFFSKLEKRGDAYVFAGGPLNGWPVVPRRSSIRAII